MPRISIRNGSLLSLMNEMRDRGTLQIPRFQRDYVWERTRVARLFDSIYHAFPIGSFFFWITPPQYRHLCKQIGELRFPNAADYEALKMILDGQQRIVSLYVTARGLSVAMGHPVPKDYKKICFNLETKEFFVATRGEDRTTTISVWRLFDEQGWQEIYNALTPEKQNTFHECRLRIQSYPLSIVEVEDMDIEGAITVFERINQGGKKLNLFDLIVASTWTPEFDLKEKTKELNEEFKNRGFGIIEDEEVFTQLLALIIKGQCTRTVQLSLTSEDVSTVWPATQEAMRLAVDFVVTNLGVKIYDFLPYPSMLVMFAYMYAKCSGRALTDQQRQFAIKWFWQTAFSQRYGVSTPTLMGNDKVEYFDPVVSGQIKNPDYPIKLTGKDIATLRISTRSAVRNAIFCLLALKNPLHFRNNTPVVLDRSICSEYNDKQKHHIFPNAFLRDQNVENRNLLMNFAFIPAELNREISAQSPKDYCDVLKSENENLIGALGTHLIPTTENSGLWTNDYDRFITNRTNLVVREIEKVIGQPLSSSSINPILSVES